ncbi:MAG TPA: hypothetical protein VFC12_07385 [Terriglobales bacterium]|nr:hypothetical protein [Terriglobales bacterium]
MGRLDPVALGAPPDVAVAVAVKARRRRVARRVESLYDEAALKRRVSEGVSR